MRRIITKPLFWIPDLISLKGEMRSGMTAFTSYWTACEALGYIAFG